MFGSMVTYLYHVSNQCHAIPSMIHTMWSSTFPIAFFVSSRVILSIKLEAEDRTKPLNGLNPLAVPVGFNLYKHPKRGIEYNYERRTFGSVNKGKNEPDIKSFFTVVKKKKFGWRKKNHGTWSQICFFLMP